MSRHSATASSPSSVRRRRVLIAAGAFVATVAVAGTAVAFSSGGADRSSTAGCQQPAHLKVWTTPALADPVSKIARAVAPACVTVDITAVADAQAATDLVESTGSTPSVWIPESSLWADQVQTRQAGATATVTLRALGSTASSPVVQVASVGGASALADASSTSAAAGTVLSLPDPNADAAGLLTLLGAQAGVTAQPGLDPSARDRALVAQLIQLGHTLLPDAAAGFTALAAGAPIAFPASEQSVIAYNHTHAAATAVAPAGGTYLLDYPYVTVARTGDAPAVADTAAAFQRSLKTAVADTVLRSAGFRDPTGAPITAAVGPGSAVVRSLGTPSAADAADVLRLWSATRLASHSLTVIDVSGSMAESAGNGQSKIAVAAAAVARGVSFYPDGSSFGLWAFSCPLVGGDQAWQVLADVAPLGSVTGGVSQRDRLVEAAGRLPSMVGSNTALYDTALAAYLSIANTYQPGQANAVILVTDGVNDYAEGLTIDSLLAQLRARVDPAKPVAVIAIGIGDKADIPALQKITAVTGGKTYAVAKPADVYDVFLDAIIQRECRPNC